MRYVLLISLVLVIGCRTGKNYSEIKAVMDSQELAWSNGDLEGFMNGYLRSDSLAFVGSKGLTFGWQNILNNYRDGYPDNAAMGTLKFDILKFKTLGRNSAMVIGEYQLTRSDREDAKGFFTIVWERVNGEWLIISDQSN
jgi:uncharacterized protein (TIGR02246 family)